MRIRSIWPGFWTSLTIAKLDLDVALGFIGLWNYADDHGRAVCDYRLLKGALFPLKDEITPVTLRAWCDQYEALGLIERYVVDDVLYYVVCSWGEFQHPNKPKPSKLPVPPNSGTEAEGTDTGSVHPTPEDGGLREGKGREGSRKGEEGKKADARTLGDEPTKALTRLTGRGR